MTWTRGRHLTAIGALALALAACVPVTVNVTFPQEKLDTAARHIEDTQSEPASTAQPTPPASSAGGGRNVDVATTPRLNEQSPEVIKVRESRREVGPAGRSRGGRGRRTQSGGNGESG